MNMSPIKRSPPTIEYILLGLLFKRTLHGYELFKEIENDKTLSLIWRVKPSNLYALLDKLESQGLLEHTRVIDEKRPNRKEYFLTATGEHTFLNWVHTPVKSMRYMRMVFLARLYFAQGLGKDSANKLIRVQIAECQEWLQNIQSRLETLGSDDFIANQVFQFRSGQVSAILKWLRECKKLVNSP
jgi:DNA-binding PadR family transcriptional regulator